MPPRIYDGSGDPQPERIILRAGALTAVYEAGMLRYIRAGGTEIVRAVYAAVRDHNWGTIPAVLRDVRVDSRDDSFDITFTSDHRQGDIHFVWKGAIRGSADSTITFTFDGEALTSFQRNRIGFCVLHPEAVAGAACAIEHVDGSVEGGAFPQDIQPHQPYFDIRAITHDVMPDVRAEVRMDGDTFEMEDQRNWTDASYKTYCTPLALPFPVQIDAGTKVQQAITVRLIGQPDALPAVKKGFVLTVDTSRTLPLPPIGLEASGYVPLSGHEIIRLHALNLSHLRMNLHPQDNVESGLARAAETARALDCALEIALHLDKLDDELERIVSAYQKLAPRVARWLVYRVGEKSTSRATVEAAKKHLEPLGVPIGAGTDAYFTQLNRQRPPADLLDWVSYSLNPQVHAFDNASLVETIPTQAATVASARRFSGDAKIAVTPVTFKIRWNPDATAAEAPTPPGELPRRVDPRQMSLFGAGWTLGSIASLAQAGADSLTYYELTGWLGVMERESGSQLPDKFPSVAGGVFPMYHVFADVGAFKGGAIHPVETSDPLTFSGIALRSGSRLRVLLANHTDASQTITVAGVGGRVEIKTLDEMNAEFAIREPKAFRAAPGTIVESGDVLRVDLAPYALTRLDFSP